MKTGSKLLLTMLGGIALGAALGVLLAPDKGSETRKKIIDRARKLSDEANDKFRHATGKKNGKRVEAEETGEYI